jgi:hypothetical protein
MPAMLRPRCAPTPAVARLETTDALRCPGAPMRAVALPSVSRLEASSQDCVIVCVRPWHLCLPFAAAAAAAAAASSPSSSSARQQRLQRRHTRAFIPTLAAAALHQAGPPRAV